jgi:CheY-like chemotaxis protein
MVRENNDPQLDGFRLVVVVDEADASALLGYLLEARGAEVRLANRAAKALLQLDTYSAHVILSDIGMPGEDGYTLIHKIRALPSARKKGIPCDCACRLVTDEDRARDSRRLQRASY